MMKRPVAITLIFLFSMTVLTSGASGYSDCAVKCMREMARNQAHTAMGSVNLQMPNCCSGGMQDACEMNSAPQVNIPEGSIASHPNLSLECTPLGFISIDTDSDQNRTTQIDRRRIAGQLNKTPPIYLLTLSILC